MTNEGQFPKVDGDIFYASEVNKAIQTKGLIARSSGLNFDGQSYATFNEGNGIIKEYFSAPTALSVTNLTHNTDVKEYFSVADGAYELVSTNYLLDSNASKCACFIDYNIYKEITETDYIATSANDSADHTADSPNLKSEKIVYAKFKVVAQRNGGAGGGYNSAGLYLSDATNSSTIIDSGRISNIVYSGYEATGFIKLIINTTTNIVKWNANYWEKITDSYNYPANAQLYNHKTTYGSVDISTWGSNLYLRALSNSDSGNLCISKVYYVRAEKLSPSTTAQIAVSVDGGSNYVNIDNYGYSYHGTSGAILKAKISGTLAANEGINIKGIILRPEV